MKYHVNEACIGCGLCVGTCPDVFEMTDNGTAMALDVDTEDPAAQEAMDGCPVSAIEEA